MVTKMDKAKALGMKYTTYLFREKNGIPMDKPFNKKPGGNYKIDEATAKKIWADLKGNKYFNTHQQIADKYDVPKTLVDNMSSGATWNQVTGLATKPRKKKPESKEDKEIIRLDIYGRVYELEREKAEKIWHDIQGNKNKITLDGIASRHGVPKSVVSNISAGRCWNHVTGLPKKVYEEDLS